MVTIIVSATVAIMAVSLLCLLASVSKPTARDGAEVAAGCLVYAGFLSFIIFLLTLAFWLGSRYYYFFG